MMISKQSRRAILSAFFACGFLSTAWIVHIPRIKGLLSLSDGQLGLCLWAATLGLLLGMSIGGWMVERFYSQFVTGFAMIALGIATILAVCSKSVVWLVLALLPFGFFAGLLDVSMNSQAAAFEQRFRQAAMSSFHAFYSIGGLAGALAGACFLALQTSPLIHALVISIPFIFWGGMIQQFLLPEQKSVSKKDFFISLPTLGLLPLALMAFTFFLAEGAIFDWAGVYLKTDIGVTTSAAGLGYGTFSLAMAIGRLFGDSWVARLGTLSVFIFGALLGASGLVLACYVRNYAIAVFGFGLFGLGLANCVPLIFSAAAKHSSSGFGRSIASVASAGYFGLFVGPPLIGQLAQRFTLPYALLAVAATIYGTLVLAKLGLGPRGLDQKRSRAAETMNIP
ncbi:MAG: MFS transporter [Verrucomicrobia bacterium]|nr:MFS transporter [Verrucomicrobiota bacterium]